MKKIAINGFGRIGRISFRLFLEQKDVKVVAVNDLADIETMVHLLKYDSTHGPLNRKVKITDDGFHIDGYGDVKVCTERNPANLPWKELGVEIVLEATGVFRTTESAMAHVEAGAKRVVLSAPAKDPETPTFVYGVNDKELRDDQIVISNASCTTNCLAPQYILLDEAYGIKMGFMNTIHAYTADQRLQDAPHKDLRRARAAAESIVPTTTGAAKAVSLVLPQLVGKLEGMAMRVPVACGSITDSLLILEKDVTAEQVNDLFRQAANGAFKNIIQVEDDPIVSIDIVNNPHSCIIDSALTNARGNVLKIVGWYDNEYGYSSRCVDLILEMVGI